MIVGFFSNQLDNRGTGNAMFDYAYYNEKILGNKSVIYTYRDAQHNQFSIDRFQQHFPIVVNPDPLTTAVDVMYHIKSGEDDGVRFPRVRYAVHAVFNARRPHGDRFAAISEWLGERDGVPWVPHIVKLPYHTTNLRSQMRVSDDILIFGRHGGADTFDIPWVWDIVYEVAEKRGDVYFLFMNTNVPDKPRHPRITFLPEVGSEVLKRKFVNTCDAMIHARGRGETFGLSVAEFASCGKPVITFSLSGEKAHLVELEKYKGDKYFYDSPDSLYYQLMGFEKKESFAYTHYYPEIVMNRFKEVFLD